MPGQKYYFVGQIRSRIRPGFATPVFKNLDTEKVYIQKINSNKVSAFIELESVYDTLLDSNLSEKHRSIGQIPFHLYHDKASKTHLDTCSNLTKILEAEFIGDKTQYELANEEITELDRKQDAELEAVLNETAEPIFQKWFVSVNESIYGPYTDDQMHGFVKEGRVISKSIISNFSNEGFLSADSFASYKLWIEEGKDSLDSPSLNVPSNYQPYVQPHSPVYSQGLRHSAYERQSFDAAYVPQIIPSATLPGIICNGHISIFFKFTGTLIANSVEITETGEVNGGVFCESLLIRGQMQGHAYAPKIDLSQTAKVSADFFQDKLTIENGAFYDGKTMPLKAEYIQGLKRGTKKFSNQIDLYDAMMTNLEKSAAPVEKQTRAK